LEREGGNIAGGLIREEGRCKENTEGRSSIRHILLCKKKKWGATENTGRRTTKKRTKSTG